MHYIEGQPNMTFKAVAEGLTKEMMDGAVHIWTKRAITVVPVGAEQYEGEPEKGTGD